MSWSQNINRLHTLQHLALFLLRFFFCCVFREQSNYATVDLLQVVGDVLLMLVILFELWEHFSDVVDHQLGELSVIVFDDEAEELSVPIVNDVSHLFLERERGKLLPFEFGVVFANMQNIDLILNFECFVHIVSHNCTVQSRLGHVTFVRVNF